jgi:hypothetical protein
MSWFRRNGKPPKNAKGIAEAEAAVQREQEVRKEIEAKEATHKDLNSSLTRHYNENNFSGLVEDSMHIRRRRT